MGTRADFYVGRGESAEWLGSVAWDGNPRGIDDPVLTATTESDFRAAVEAFFTTRDDATRPREGWPWPWDSGLLTDYSYALDEGRVYASNFGQAWFPVDVDAPFRGEPQWDEVEPYVEPPQVAVFPDMSAVKNVTLGRRSGVVVIGPFGVENPE